MKTVDEQTQPDQDQPAQTNPGATSPPEAQTEVQASSGSSAKAEASTEPKAPPSSEESPTELPSPVKSAGKVLLIEDDLTLAKMYATKLQGEGFEVKLTYDGEKGLAKIGEWDPDLVVLDLMIPKVGGIEVLEQLRANPKTKTLPVIVLSNLSQEHDFQRVQELGAKEFLVKANYTPSQVVEKIKEYLKK